AGSLLGLSFWWSRNYAAIAQPYIICFESLPKLALAPLIILVFGLGLTSKVVIAFALTVVVSTLTTFAGVKALDPDSEKLFYSLGASRWQVFRKLVMPFCLPWIISVLRMYIGMAKDYFAEADINVKIVTIETGSGHTNAVLSGQAFAFIGGPEHNAFAKAKGAELRAVVHCVDRGNVYFCAEKGLEPNGRDFGAFAKGKAIATGGFGGTPNSITRYLLKKWKLDAKNDVTLV